MIQFPNTAYMEKASSLGDRGFYRKYRAYFHSAKYPNYSKKRPS